MGCSENSITMCDCFIYWQDILGKPSSSTSLGAYIDGKIAENNENLTNLIADEIDKLTDKIKDEIQDTINTGIEDLDPYKIKYNETTVGEALDVLFDEEFSGNITPEIVYEKGRKVYDELVTWSYNKPVIKQTITITHANSPAETTELNPDARNFKIDFTTDDVSIVVNGETAEGSVITLSTKIVFKFRMFYGTCPSAIMTNEQILGLNSLLIDENDRKFVHLFNCSDGNYLYYLFPYDMHMYYNFYSNRMKDNTYLWEIKRVVNQYGYAYDYIKFRTPIALTGHDILSEVYAHEAY